MIRSAFFSLFAFALGGCLTIPEGVFACFDASDCPEDFDCVSGLCVEEGGAAMRQCDDGSATIRLTEFCDGVPDCDDGSDELECVPCVDSADPATDTLIPRAWLCDGRVDCPAFAGDASRFVDEDQCLPCDDGEGTVHSFFNCDGTLDCADGSDEVECFYCVVDGEDPSIVSEPIARWMLCDGKDDCALGQDESLCNGAFACADGLAVIANNFVCDGFVDCGDGSDEESALCSVAGTADRTPTEVWPATMQCAGFSGDLPTWAFCQGVTQCDDGSDELRANCPFLCLDGTRIPREFLCDTTEDCPYGEDEVLVRGTDPCAL